MRRFWGSPPVLVYLAALAFFLLTCSGMMHGGDGVSQIKASMLLVSTGTPSYAAEPPDELFLRSPNGRYYEAHDLGNILLMTPACAVVQVAHKSPELAKPLFMVLNCFVSALGPVFVYLLCSLFHGRRRSALLAALFVLATPYGAFARATWDVLGGTVATAAALYCLFALLAGPERRMRHALGLGTALGLVGMFRYSYLPFLLLPAILCLGMAWREIGGRRIGAVAAAYLATMLPTFYYNWVRIGTPLLPATTAAKFLQGPNYLVSTPWQTLPLLVFSPNWGMLFFCPMLALLALAPLALRRRPNPLKWAFVWLLLGSLVYMWCISKLANWTGVVGWGSRYMVLLYPMLLLLLSFIFFDLHRSWRGLTALAVGFTLLLNLPIPFVNWQYATKRPAPLTKIVYDDYRAMQPRQQAAVWEAFVQGWQGHTMRMNPEWANQPRLRTIVEFPDNWLVRLARNFRHGAPIALLLTALLLGLLLLSARQFLRVTCPPDRLSAAPPPPPAPAVE